MTDSQHLLAEYAENGSDAAFRELVARYVDLVYSTALRLVEGDTHRAEDVTQTVFVDLARMAGKLSAKLQLGGWLHRHTCFVARTVMRGERRRQARERQAVEMNALQNHSEALAQIAPLLDEAINELGADDRDAILLRFFERRNLRAVGDALGTNENVAQKRVARAVRELGVLLRRRGLPCPPRHWRPAWRRGGYGGASRTGVGHCRNGLCRRGSSRWRRLTPPRWQCWPSSRLGLSVPSWSPVWGPPSSCNTSPRRGCARKARWWRRPDQPDAAELRPQPANPEMASPLRMINRGECPERGSGTPNRQASVEPVTPPARQTVAVPEQTVADNPSP